MLRGKSRIVSELVGMLLVGSVLFAQTDSTPSKTTTSSPKTTATHKSSTTSKPAPKAASASHTVHTTKSKRAGTKSASSSTSSHRGKKSSKKSAKRGQQKIECERAQQIQEALIKQHYLSGEPTGKWDPATEDALRKFQADNGWQNKTVPDSRALIKLGLGPSHDHLLNPESAMTTVPDTPSTPTAANRSAARDSGPSQSQPQQ